MKRNSASRKFSEQAQHALATILLVDIQDPALRDVVISDAEVSLDKRLMRVYVSTDPNRYTRVLKALNRAKGRMRAKLAVALAWRVVPDLVFEIDHTTDAADALSKALAHKPPSLVARERDEEDKKQ